MSGLRPFVYFAFLPTKILWLTPQSLSIIYGDGSAVEFLLLTHIIQSEEMTSF